MCQKLTYLNKFMKSKTSFFNSKVFARYNYYRKSLLEMIRLYLYDCSVYLVTALISIGLTTLILRTYLPLFVLRNGSLYAIIRTCSYICTYFLFVLHTLMYTYDILFCFIPRSIYSWSLGHILEHEFFCLGHLGCAGSN